MIEQTLLLIKPCGTKRGLIGKVLTRFEEAGFQIVLTKIVKLDHGSDLLKNHYYEHYDQDYYPGIEEHMTSGRIFAFVIEGENAVKRCRKMLGKTDPMDAEMGTIRADLASSRSHNICHASDSLESAEREIKLWF